MLLFWLFAGLLAGGAALLILLRAARSERLAASGDDAVTSVYRRQLTEIDELAERGLLGPEEHRSARAEAARRLLGEADKGAARPAETPRASRRLILAAAVIAPLIALGGYLAIGSPWLPDQPFAARMTAWRRTDPARLSLPQMEALLQAAVARQPNDAQGLIYLARVQAAEGDIVTGARTLQKAARLAPGDARVWTALGEALAAQGQGEITPEARDAFERAAAIDPSAPEPHYFIGRAEIAAGQTGPGLDQWRLVLAALPAGDPRRAVLDRDIAEVARTGRLPAPPVRRRRGPRA